MSGFCQDRTVIVTGAGGGLGRAYAIALGAEGANVIVNDINAETAAETVEAIASAGGQAMSNLDDITDYDAAGGILKKTLDVYCLLYTSPSPRDKRQSRMPSSA